ncbi:uncharacterized protein KQ657_003686 [Scheffersomyces spartinae]|uniref:Importin N-terminal domain-containing protein n=1 Tax=Scheffersomyces spartinae TaxID=45513 RepID=A0A9P7VC43_9ASCO|nr:uncharacterized protein KQ657_003686 [Scheffersomyces spartinae]KAG7195162.1 hypothetical protein KQ657_003686 [Scheffersomyces spartinae]
MADLDPQFVSLVESTLLEAVDATTAGSAAEKLKSLTANESAIPAFISIAQTGRNDIGMLALVEARKLIKAKWETLNPQLRDFIKQQLLTVTFEHTNERSRHLCAECIAAIVLTDAEPEFLTQLIPTLNNAIQDSVQQTRETAVYTLYLILETELPTLVENAGDFVSLFSRLLTDSSSQVRIDSIRSLDILGQFLDQSVDKLPRQHVEAFQASIPGMIAIGKDTVVSDIDQATTIFQIFNSMLLLDEAVLGDAFLLLLEFCTEVAANASVDEDVRMFALNCLIECVDYKKQKIVSNKLGPKLTLLAAKIASEEVDAEEELETEDEEHENEESSSNALALRFIQTLANELPASQVIVPFFDAFNSMISSPNQFERRAGFLIIANCVEGCEEHISSYLPKLMPVLINGLKDPEILVKLATLKCLNNIIFTLKDEVASHHEQLLPLVIDTIDNTKSVMVYKYGCRVLDSLIEYMDQDTIGKYLEPLMNKLSHMLQEANTSSLKNVIVSAMGSSAFASGKMFTPYLPTAIQTFEPFIQNAGNIEGMSNDDIELRALTLETIAVMAKAVGSEGFQDYASQLVEAAYGALSSESHRIREAGFAFIADMAKVFGTQFASSLNNIVPLILKSLEQEEPLILADVNEEEYEELLKVYTGITFEKEIAIVALGELASGTGKSFAPFVTTTLEVLTEEFKNGTLSEVSLNCMWRIARSMYFASKGEDFKYPKGILTELYVEPTVLELIKHVRALCLENLLEDDDDYTNCSILENLSNEIDLMGAIVVMDPHDGDQSLFKLCELVQAILARILDESEADFIEDSAQLYKDCLEVLVSLSSCLEEGFEPIFTKFHPVLVANSTVKDKEFRLASVGALAQISAGLKQNNPKFQELLELFIDRLTNDKNLDVRGDSVYGVGIIIENAEFNTSPIYPTLLSLLNDLLSKTDRRAGKLTSSAGEDDEELEAKLEVINRAYANACGCVGRMALKHPELVPLPVVLPILLNHLPLENGLEENQPIFNLLIKLYETKSEIGVQALPQVIDMFAKVFTKEAERLKLLGSSTIGREEEFEGLNHFPVEGLKEKVINLLKFLDSEYQGVVSGNQVLKLVIA